MLPRKERLEALQAYLSGPHPDDEEETKWMTEYLEFLKATADKPVHACRLTSKVDQTETKLETMDAGDAHRMRGIGLAVKLNDRSAHLFLKTRPAAFLGSTKVPENSALPPPTPLHIDA